MKFAKRFLLILVIILAAAAATAYFYLKNTTPKYEGTLQLEGIESQVDVHFDPYGIPHIYAQNAEDAYFALGYVQAQDRLFQMEMIRRLTSGRMAEILGEELLETDKYFRTLGIREAAEKSVQEHFSGNEEAYQKESLAYLAGINQFLENGQTPLEFNILGIPKEPFSPADIYTTMGYMSFGFTAALKEEPIVNIIKEKWGEDYLKDMQINPAWQADSTLTDLPSPGFSESLSFISPEQLLEQVSMPLWDGSNAWVIAARKSISGKVLLANDTHIKFSQPSVWYEAHLEYPGFSFYGHYLAGVPFAVVGHNRKMGWGLTIFPIDNMDLYRERVNPENAGQVWQNDHWADLETRREIIKVKGGEDVILDVKISRHGPIINEVAQKIKNAETAPIALWWVLLRQTTTTMQAFYALNHAQGIDDAREAVSKIDVMGLNVMYGDVDDNIAWWASGKIPRRQPQVNSKFILDGAGGEDDPLGFYDFSENPQAENPPEGFLVSANHEPEPVNNIVYEGYYLPDHRKDRITTLLSAKNIWTLEGMKDIQRDITSDVHAGIAKLMAREMTASRQFDEAQAGHREALEILKNWDGAYALDDTAPVVFTKLIYYVLEGALKDELGEDIFRELITTYGFKRSMPIIVNNENSAWWDDQTTEGVKESRTDIFTAAFEKAIGDLQAQLGTSLADWKWEKVHSLTHHHPIGSKKPFDQIFNVGPIPVPGGNEVPNNFQFDLNEKGIYAVKGGPALRILIDFNDVENSLGINPTGQSGNVMSPHYDDQAAMFAGGVYRKQMLNREEIQENSKVLSLLPLGINPIQE